jgi:hypothetical protein
MAFSRTGLIEQLVFEGFSSEASRSAVTDLDVDWYQQAALKAVQYLNSMGFSRKGLIEQLMFEGFTREEAIYGTNDAGL